MLAQKTSDLASNERINVSEAENAHAEDEDDRTYLASRKLTIALRALHA